MIPYSSVACMVRVSVSRGSIKRSGSGIGTENQNLIFSQRGLRNAVTGLDQRRVFGFSVVLTPVTRLKKLRIDTALVVSSAPVDDLQHVRFANHAGGDLNTAGAPAVGHWHFGRRMAPR